MYNAVMSIERICCRELNLLAMRARHKAHNRIARCRSWATTLCFAGRYGRGERTQRRCAMRSKKERGRWNYGAVSASQIQTSSFLTHPIHKQRQLHSRSGWRRLTVTSRFGQLVA